MGLTWQAPAGCTRIDLLSDVHLHPQMPRTFEAWRGHMLSTPAQAILILGDLFEVWVGDDACQQPFEAACLDVLRQAGQSRMLAFVPGNRDFLLGAPLLASVGTVAWADPSPIEAFGQRILLSHGDALCVADLPYQQFRAQVRSAAWQAGFLAQPLGLRQDQARAMRDASMQHQAQLGPENWSDVDDGAACQALDAARCRTLIHGHTHRPGMHELGTGRSRWVLGDWDLDHGGTPRSSCLALTASGLQRFDAQP